MTFLSKRAFTAAVVLAMLGATLYAGQARAAEGAGLVIGHVTATEVAEHEVKVEAQINPGGLEAAYSIWLVRQQADPKGGPTNDGEPPTGGPQTQTGKIAAGSGYQTVSATLTGLQWGYTYYGVVAASNSACEKAKGEFGIALHISGEFPNGQGTGGQYESGNSVLVQQTFRRRVSEDPQRIRSQTRSGTRSAARQGTSGTGIQGSCGEGRRSDSTTGTGRKRSRDQRRIVE